MRAYSPSARAAPPESWAQASACDLGEKRPLASVGPDYASGKLDEDSTNLGVWRTRTLRSAVLRGQEDRRRADVTAHARSAPGRTASPGSEAPARACAPGEGREMAGVGARGRLVMGWPVLLLLALCAAGARGLYFHIGETEKRCFIEEIPDETMVIGQAGRGWTGPCVSPRRGCGSPLLAAPGGRRVEQRPLPGAPGVWEPGRAGGL